MDSPVDEAIPSGPIDHHCLLEDVVEVWIEPVTREDRHYLLLARGGGCASPTWHVRIYRIKYFIFFNHIVPPLFLQYGGDL